MLPVLEIPRLPFHNPHPLPTHTHTHTLAHASMVRLSALVFAAASWSLATAHTVIVYPPWRGNNIHTNGTVAENDASIPPGSRGMNYHNDTDSYGYPYGMQWMYPCA